MQITAAVVPEKLAAFTIDKLELTDPRTDEALVRIVASGMCQTDLHGRDGYYDTPYPAVYGHEGAGVVQAVGNSVTKFAPGDHVVISFPWCGVCPNCRRNMQSHCMKGLDLKMRGTRPDGSTLMRKGGVHEDRLTLARALGATHAINHRGRSDVVAEIRRITGDGVRFSLETSAQPAVFREAVEALIAAGTCVLLGSARSGTEVSFEMPFLQFGRVVRGVIQGESHPQEFIPKLVDFLMQGKMPVDRMMTFYPLAEINRAAQESSQGTTIKPVLRMPN